MPPRKAGARIQSPSESIQMPMPMLDRRLLIAFAATAMLASGAALAATPKTAAERAYAAVDPFIGTGGGGDTDPGAAGPFGLGQLSPGTRIPPRGKGHCWAGRGRHDHSRIGRGLATHFFRTRPSRL